jgi:hypothetical protein
MTSVPTEAGFDGYPPSWYYLDTAASTLSTTRPSKTRMLTGTNASVSIWPRYLNAPSAAIGSNNQTKFEGNGKPNAYVKVQVDQNIAGTSSTKPLTWSAMYPIIDNPNDNIHSTYFDDPVSGDPVEHVPIPGGTAKLRIPLTAVVGGQHPSTLLNIIDKVMGLATSTAGKTLFAIPAADIALATTVESLVNLASSAFAPDTKQQYWLNEVHTDVRLVDAEADDSLELPLGTNFFVAFPTGGNGEIDAAVQQILAKTYALSLDRGGTIIAKQNGAIVDPNPFANLIYVTFRVTVTAAS